MRYSATFGRAGVAGLRGVTVLALAMTLAALLAASTDVAGAAPAATQETRAAAAQSGSWLDWVLKWAPSRPSGSCARRLAKAYPQSLSVRSGSVYVIQTGDSIPCGDVQTNAPMDWRLANATLSDQLSQSYPLGPNYPTPTGDHDPGRLRHVPLFKAMYGATEAQVRANLTAVQWIDGGKLPISKVNGAADALARVVAELKLLSAEYRPFLDRPSGTFNWRPVAGTNYLSAHSFGIAIDINIQQADYWFWDAQRKGKAAYRNRIPYEIVQIFERHGFIWGGKWAHYDTMHFEYRPELLTAR